MYVKSLYIIVELRSEQLYGNSTTKYASPVNKTEYFVATCYTPCIHTSLDVWFYGGTFYKMQEVQNISQQVDKLIEEIAQAANDEALAARQVETGISQINEVVQQNSATAEQTAASCEELSAQANVLSEKVATLKA